MSRTSFLLGAADLTATVRVGGCPCIQSAVDEALAYYDRTPSIRKFRQVTGVSYVYAGTYNVELGTDAYVATLNDNRIGRL